MYNETLKQEYLSVLPSADKRYMSSAKRVFESSTKIEEALGKDIALFTPEEMTIAFNRAMFIDYYMLSKTRTVLARYGKWYCEKNGLPESMCRISEFKPSRHNFSVAMGQMLSRDFQEVYLLYSSITPPIAGSTIPPASVLAWEGVQLQQAILLKESEVDIANRKIFFNDSWHEISQLEADVLDRYMKTEEEVITQNQTYTRRKIPGDTLIRLFKSKNSAYKDKPVATNYAISLHFFTAQERLKEEGSGLAFAKLGYDMISRSGRYYRLHEWEKQGNNIFDFKNGPEVFRILGSKIKTPKHSDTHALYVNYINYKRAFYPSEIIDIPKKYLKMTTP